MLNPDNINILIVDDNALVLKAYKSVLAKRGYRILTASNGKKALRIIGQEELSLILLDVVLPDLSGLEILRLIKTNPRYEHIFVVLISSMATSAENQIEGMELGADGYLIKPMPAWELMVRVNGFLKHKRTIDLLKISEERYRIISEKTSEALKESNAYLHAILENNSNIFIAMDNDFIIQFANKPAIKMCRIIFGQELAVGKPVLEIVGDERFEQFRNDVSYIEGGKPAFIERRYIRKNKPPIWIGIQYSHLTDHLDNSLGVFMIVSDITRRKEAEELILKYQTELENNVEERTSELVSLNKELQKLSNVVEQAADHVLITNKEGIIQYVNPAFESGTGYMKEEVIGLTPRILNSSTVHPEFFKKLWDTVLSGQIYRGESINKKKNGELYFESMTVTPLIDINNNITHLVSVGSDITLRRQAETDRNAREAADQANKAKSLFLANMSHEIRTPMNAIIGFSDLLYASIKDEKQRSQIDAIRSSGKNLLRIINDILDLSKIEAGKMMIHTESINILDIIREIETIFAYVTKEKGIKFLIDLPKQIPAALMLDETRVRQILFNLIGNAVKFTDKGEVTLSVIKKITGEEKIDLIFTVKDTGIGIPDDQQHLIFDAFTQQDGQRSAQFGGTGLGLTITKRLVEMMGGNIRLSSEPGIGSLFTVTLPGIKIKKGGKKESEMSLSETSTLFFDQGSVLIADDNQENRQYLVDLLSHFPLTLIEAQNGSEAIESAQRYLPDVILMDLRMPVMNGNEAIERLKKDITTNTIPIIALSASSPEVFDEQNGAAEFDDFLLKPIIAAQLLELLKKYLKFHLVSKSTPVATENSPDSEINLTIVQKNMLPGLIMLLENQYAPIFKDVAKKQVVGQIKTFGEQLYALGKEQSNPVITDFGKALSTYANNFEINKMMKILITFPEIINRLKKLM
jgi:PAS domain S-box-containing protein